MEQSTTILVEKYASLLEYFGEDSNLKCQDFFAIMSRFSSEFVVCRDNLERIRKLEERREKTRIELEEKTKLKADKAIAEAKARVDNASMIDMQLVTPGDDNIYIFSNMFI